MCYVLCVCAMRYVICDMWCVICAMYIRHALCALCRPRCALCIMRCEFVRYACVSYALVLYAFVRYALCVTCTRCPLCAVLHIMRHVLCDVWCALFDRRCVFLWCTVRCATCDMLCAIYVIRFLTSLCVMRSCIILCGDYLGFHSWLCVRACWLVSELCARLQILEFMFSDVCSMESFWFLSGHCVVGQRYFSAFVRYALCVTCTRCPLCAVLHIMRHVLCDVWCALFDRRCVFLWCTVRCATCDMLCAIYVIRFLTSLCVMRSCIILCGDYLGFHSWLCVRACWLVSELCARLQILEFMFSDVCSMESFWFLSGHCVVGQRYFSCGYSVRSLVRFSYMIVCANLLIGAKIVRARLQVLQSVVFAYVRLIILAPVGFLRCRTAIYWVWLFCVWIS